MWEANLTTDSVILGVRFFFVMRMLRGGEGHCKLSRVFEGDCMYDGLIREGRSDMCLISGRREVEVKLRDCNGGTTDRQGRARCCGSLMVVGEWNITC